MATKSREKLIREKNKITPALDPLPNDIVWRLINEKGKGAGESVEEFLYRLAVEVQFYRLERRLYGG